MPCTERFDAQEADYRDSVLPPDISKRIAIEASHKDFWYKYVGLGGAIVGMDTFGESAPASDLFQHFGFSLENVLQKVEALL